MSLVLQKLVGLKSTRMFSSTLYSRFAPPVARNVKKLDAKGSRRVRLISQQPCPHLCRRGLLDKISLFFLVLFSLRTAKDAAKAAISALAFSYTSPSESLPFHKPETWKRYPFRAEPPRIGHHREFPPPPFQFRASTHLLPAHVGL